MLGKFAHSFDRETFHGTDNTRQVALKTALDKALTLENVPEMVYIGKRVPIDPGTSGLAEMILGAMRRRVRDESGDGSRQYLMRVNEHQLAELDDEIDRVIRAWMAKHELMPTQSKVIAISEHPVPQPSMTASSNGKGSSEVSDLGESNYPFSLS